MVAKLSKIGVTNTAQLISNISYINPLLLARRLRTLHKTTWEGLHLAIITGYHPVVPAMYTPLEVENRTQLTRILTNVARLKRMGEQDLNIDSWTNAILYKLSVIGVFTIYDLITNLPDLNHKLNAHGHVSLSTTTMQALTTLLPSNFRPGQI